MISGLKMIGCFMARDYTSAQATRNEGTQRRRRRRQAVVPNGARGRDRTTDTAIFSHHFYVFVGLPDVATLENKRLSHQLVC